MINNNDKNEFSTHISHQQFWDPFSVTKTHPYESFYESRTGVPDQADNLDVQVAVPNVLEAT